MSAHFQASARVPDLRDRTSSSPPSRSREFILSQFSKNIEKACETARAHCVRARAITFYLKTQEFTYHRIELTLATATANPTEIIASVMSRFNELYVPGIFYRATGVTLRGIVHDDDIGPDLFGTLRAYDAVIPIFRSIDMMNRRYGRATVFLASSMQALAHRDAINKRVRAHPHTPAMHRDQRRKSIDLPFLGLAR